jgi:hypothetical protein
VTPYPPASHAEVSTVTAARPGPTGQAHPATAVHGTGTARIFPIGSDGRVKATGTPATAPKAPGGHLGFAFTR